MTVARRLRARFGAHCLKGKQALAAGDRDRVDLRVGHSVALDEWGKAEWPRCPRWDYALVESGRVLAIEVHSATAGDVRGVLAKKPWAIERLQEAIVTAEQWWWIPSGRNTIPSTGAARRQLAQAGIRLARRVLDRSQVRGD